MEISWLRPSRAGLRSRKNSAASSERQVENGIIQPASPFQGLDQWEAEPDLIQLRTPRLSAYQPTLSRDGGLVNDEQLSTGYCDRFFRQRVGAFDYL